MAGRPELERLLAGRPGGSRWALVHVHGTLTVNLALGWEAGNAFISANAESLAAIVGTSGQVTHLGGPDFAIVPVADGRAVVEELANRCRSELPGTVEIDGRSCETNATVTVAVVPENGTDPLWSANREHQAEVSLETKQLIRQAFAGHRDLASLASEVAERCVSEFGNAACEVQLGDATAQRGVSRASTEANSFDVEIDGRRLGVVRWWPAGGQLPAGQSMLRTIADELGIAASRLVAAEDAHTDPLTGALNRRGLDFRTRQLALPYAVAMVELDDLKKFNDTWGHAAGDEALIHLCRALEAGRVTEIVARWGGDEFVVVFRDADAVEVAGRLNRLLDQVQADDVLRHHRVRFSAGVADGTGDLSGDIETADAAMYEAKRAGKARVHIATGLG